MRAYFQPRYDDMYDADPPLQLAHQQYYTTQQTSRARSNRLCTLRPRNTDQKQFGALETCRVDSLCPYSYQCPSASNFLPVEVQNLDGQSTSSQVGCYACRNGVLAFIPKTTGHLNMSSDKNMCGAQLTSLSSQLTGFKNAPYFNENQGSKTVIAGYVLIKIGTVIAGGPFMSVDSSFYIRLDDRDPVKNVTASGDDSIVASMIIVNGTLRPDTSAPGTMVSSSGPFANLSGTGVVLAGSIFSESRQIADQTNKPGVELVFRGEPLPGRSVNVSVNNVPVTKGTPIVVYAYLGIATNETFTVQLISTSPFTSDIIFNLEAYSYHCASTRLKPPVLQKNNDGRMLPSLVGCYVCEGTPPTCTFKANSNGRLAVQNNQCDYKCDAPPPVDYSVDCFGRGTFNTAYCSCYNEEVANCDFKISFSLSFNGRRQFKNNSTQTSYTHKAEVHAFAPIQVSGTINSVFTVPANVNEMLVKLTYTVQCSDGAAFSFGAMIIDVDEMITEGYSNFLPIMSTSTIVPNSSPQTINDRNDSAYNMIRNESVSTPLINSNYAPETFLPDGLPSNSSSNTNNAWDQIQWVTKEINTDQYFVFNNTISTLNYRPIAGRRFVIIAYFGINTTGTITYATQQNQSQYIAFPVVA